MSDLLKPISSKNIDNFNQWSMPDVKSNNTVAATTLKKKGKSGNPKVETIDEQYESVEDIKDDSPEEKVTAQQLEKITEDARKDGYDEGYKEGHKEGFEKGEGEGKEEGLKQSSETIKQKVECLQMLIDTLLIPIEKEKKELSNLLEKTVILLVKSIAKKELQLDSSIITECVDKALTCIEKNRDPVSLYLNSKDDEIVKKHLESTEWNINYKVDDELLPGGCRVETEESSVDFSIEEQIHQVLEQVKSTNQVE